MNNNLLAIAWFSIVVAELETLELEVGMEELSSKIGNIGHWTQFVVGKGRSPLWAKDSSHHTYSVISL